MDDFYEKLWREAEQAVERAVADPIRPMFAKEPPSRIIVRAVFKVIEKEFGALPDLAQACQLSTLGIRVMAAARKFNEAGPEWDAVGLLRDWATASIDHPDFEPEKQFTLALADALEEALEQEGKGGE